MSAGGLPDDRGVEVRGIIAKNGRGELCFFATAMGEGVPILTPGGSWASQPWEVRSAILAAPPRRKTHDELERLDP